MPVSAKKLLDLLDPDRPAEVRRAAALVLGELGGRDAEIARGLCEHLDDGERAVRLEVIRAVADHAEVIAFDCVELSPLPGLHAPDFLAAKLVYKTLSLILRHRD